jgi:hypothetical protein
LGDERAKLGSNTTSEAFARLRVKELDHEEDFVGMRNLFNKLNTTGQELRSVYVVNTDGADSSSTVVPSLATSTKMEDVKHVTVKIQGVQVVGLGLWIFKIPEYVYCGANMVCTTLTLMFQEAQVLCATKLHSMPKIFVLQVSDDDEKSGSITLFLLEVTHEALLPPLFDLSY